MANIRLLKEYAKTGAVKCQWKLQTRLQRCNVPRVQLALVWHL